MNPKRKKVEDTILLYIDKIDVGSKKENTTLYKNLFAKMSDVEFNTFMKGLKDKTITLSMIVPNGGNVKITVENNFKIAKELGHEFFQQIKITGQEDLPDYITPIKHLSFILPIRRASQLLSKKISIPESDRTIDVMSGQVTGKSKSSKLTMPEIQMLIGMGLYSSVRELLKVRGGDIQANNAMNAMLYKTGVASQATVEQYASGVESTKTLRAYLEASHIKTSL
jgi:hypothetical protein